VRRALAVAPVVVICPDEASCLDAIRMWSPRLRFPVLIDDGSHDAAADIARFVRAFEPEQVLWFESGEGRAAGEPADKGSKEAADEADGEAPGGSEQADNDDAGDKAASGAGSRVSAEDFRARAEAAVARAWGVRPQDETIGEPSQQQALLAWDAMELHPFGVVACDPAHPSRIAA